MNLIIGNKLKNLRKEKGWTQEQVSEQLHMSQSSYARIENGESHSWASHIKKICIIFKIGPEQLVKMSDDECESEDQITNKRMTEIALLEVYRKIIRRYELQIIELKQTIEDSRQYKNRKKKK